MDAIPFSISESVSFFMIQTLEDKMETTTNWRQIGAKQIFRGQTKTWGQTGDSEPTIKGLSQLALSLSLSLTSLLYGSMLIAC